MLLPVGDQCNLRCRYCFHHSAYTPSRRAGAVTRSDDAYRVLWRQVAELDVNEITFLWHGGEPLLAGMSVFADALEAQRSALPDKKIRHSLQTNATLIDAAWADLLAQNGFGVGVSIDGPPSLHDANRTTIGGKGSATLTRRGIALLQDAGVNVSAITVVSATNVDFPERVIDELLDVGLKQLAFSTACDMPGARVRLEPPASELRRFHARAFSYWLSLNDPSIRVREYVEAIKALLGEPPRTCVHRHGGCADFVAVDRHGDVFACSRYTGHAFGFLGNIRETNLCHILKGNRRMAFLQKSRSLPPNCLACEVLKYCHGGCIHHRETCTSGSFRLACTGRRQVYSSAREALRRHGVLADS